jgi:HEAT repeat protein
MKLQSVIATALVLTIVSAVLAQNPAENARLSEPDLQAKLDVYVGQLKHGNVEERREAVVALGRIGERAKAAAPALAEALKSEDAVLRVDVAEALWQANENPAAVVALVAALKDKNTNAFANAIEALSRIGPGAKAAAPALRKALDESWQWEPMRIAWLTLPSSGQSSCGPCGTPPPPGLNPAQAAWLLWRIEKHPAAMPALIKSRAYGYLGLIGAEANAAVPVIAELLKTEDGWTRIHVAIALWRINKHSAAVPTLIASLKEKTPGLRLERRNPVLPACVRTFRANRRHRTRRRADGNGKMRPEAPGAGGPFSRHGRRVCAVQGRQGRKKRFRNRFLLGRSLDPVLGEGQRLQSGADEYRNPRQGKGRHEGNMENVWRRQERGRGGPGYHRGSRAHLVGPAAGGEVLGQIHPERVGQ